MGGCRVSWPASGLGPPASAHAECITAPRVAFQPDRWLQLGIIGTEQPGQQSRSASASPPTHCLPVGGLAAHPPHTHTKNPKPQPHL